MPNEPEDPARKRPQRLVHFKLSPGQAAPWPAEHIHMEQDSGPVALEVHVRGAIVKGNFLPSQNTLRFIDELNRSETQFDLHDVSVRLLGASAEQVYPRMTIAKQALIAAIPSRPEGRAVFTGITQMSTTKTRSQVRVNLVLDQLTVAGTAHVSFGAGAVALYDFAHYFAITDAEFAEVDGTTRRVDTVLVNREAVRGFVIQNATDITQRVA